MKYDKLFRRFIMFGVEGGEKSSDGKPTLNERVVQNRCLFFFNFLVVGCINNNGYTMVHAGSSSIAEAFN